MNALDPVEERAEGGLAGRTNAEVRGLPAATRVADGLDFQDYGVSATPEISDPVARLGGRTGFEVNGGTCRVAQGQDEGSPDSE